MLTKLLFRHLPDYYPATSAYAHFPFMVPEMMRGFAKELPGDIGAKYKWDRPPAPTGPTVIVKRYSDVQQLFAEPTIFTSGAEQRLDYLSGGVSLNITPVRPSPCSVVLPNSHFFLKVEQVLTSDIQLEEATRAFSQITEGLIRQKKLKGVSVGHRTMYLDIVRDVINLVPVYWLSNNIVSLVCAARDAFGLP
jgi:linoleate 10R-lipoxygenase